MTEKNKNNEIIKKFKDRCINLQNNFLNLFLFSFLFNFFS